MGVIYFVGAEYRNKGYASETVKYYVRYFFEHYDEIEIIATIREDNISSIPFLFHTKKVINFNFGGRYETL